MARAVGSAAAAQGITLNKHALSFTLQAVEAGTGLQPPKWSCTGGVPLVIRHEQLPCRRDRQYGVGRGVTGGGGAQVVELLSRGGEEWQSGGI